MSAAPRPEPVSLPELLDTQDRVLSRHQALLSGVTEDAWQWKLDTGVWRALLPGVVVAHSGPPSTQQLAWAAVLYAGRDAALSGDLALVQHGMRLPSPQVVHVAVPRRRAVRPQAFRLVDVDGEPVRLRVHAVNDLERWVHPVRRPDVLRVPAAALHAAAWATSDRAAEWRLAATVQQRLVKPSQLREVLAQMPRLRRRALIGAVIDDVELGAHARSELDFLRFLRRHRLPLPDRLQRPVRLGKVRYLDAWWERQRVGVEVDGAHHMLAGDWDADTLRANDVIVSGRGRGDVLLRLTGGNLRHDGDVVARQLSAVLL